MTYPILGQGKSMKITTQKCYYFDIEKERKRINHCFKGDVKKRQLKLLDAFVNGDIVKWVKLYNQLPYNDEKECPEQEYVGMEIFDFIDKESLSGAKIIKIERNK